MSSNVLPTAPAYEQKLRQHSIQFFQLNQITIFVCRKQTKF